MISVIIVDDELLMRIGLKSMIDWEEHGFKIVAEATNGEEALQLIDKYNPDLVITDIVMPIVDGLNLIRKAQQTHPNCMFIILSCMDEFKYAKEAIRLGALDYLIKSDLKHDQLFEALEKVKNKKILQQSQSNTKLLNGHFHESIGYLKENFFKELLSGFVHESEIINRAEQVQFQVIDGPMCLVKFSINQFHHIRQKYVEQDEKLLRYSIVNILEEVIPRKYKREIVIQNSAHYFCLLSMELFDNVKQLDSIFRKVKLTIKEFLKIDLGITVSPIIEKLFDIRCAYQKIEDALEEHFFTDDSTIIYVNCETDKGKTPRLESYSLSNEWLSKLRECIELRDEKAYDLLEDIRQSLITENVSEQGVRKVYLSLFSLITSCFPMLPDVQEGDLSPYEQLLNADKLSSIHQMVVQYLELLQEYNKSKMVEATSYSEQAKKILQAQFHNDISLQSVAKELNVNPSYLSRVFKQETGDTFVNALTKIRIDHAQKLLRNSNLKIYDISAQCGYQNTAYFSKLFKKVTGFSPEEFRVQCL